MNINNLIRDWAYKVNDGCPDPKNRTHLKILEAVLKQYKYPQNFIKSYISQIKGEIVESKRDASLNTAMMETAACIGIAGISTSAIDPLLNLPNIFKKQRDLNVAYSIIDLMKHIDEIENFNKKSLYILIREMTDVNTSHITSVVNVLKKHYKKIFNEYYKTGTIFTNKTGSFF